MTTAAPIVIYGPASCGKTAHAERLRAHFGLDRVVDGVVGGDQLEPGTLGLTNEPGFPGALDFQQVMATINPAETESHSAQDPTDRPAEVQAFLDAVGGTHRAPLGTSSAIPGDQTVQ